MLNYNNFILIIFEIELWERAEQRQISSRVTYSTLPQLSYYFMVGILVGGYERSYDRIKLDQIGDQSLLTIILMMIITTLQSHFSLQSLKKPPN